jgi:hypothetical protein
VLADVGDKGFEFRQFHFVYLPFHLHLDTRILGT